MLRTLTLAAAGAAMAGSALAQVPTTPAPAPAAQPAPAPACSRPEYRQLDFWVGDWDLEFDQANGQVGKAVNRITRDEYGDCVITERFEQASNGYSGMSVSIYDPLLRTWRQTWVDNGGGVFVLTGGPVEGQPHVFELRTTEPRGQGANAAVRRMIWEDVTADSLTWRWQAQQADGGWADQWVLRYKRKQPG